MSANVKMQASLCKAIKPAQMVTWRYTEIDEFICCMSADRCRVYDSRLSRLTPLPSDCPAPWDEDDRAELDEGLALNAVCKL